MTMAYLRRLLRDPLFVRVLLAVYGGGLGAIGALVVWNFRAATVLEGLLLGFFAFLLGLGLYMVAVAVGGSPERLDAASGLISDGNELLVGALLLAVAVVALPLVWAVRALQRLRR